MHTVTLAWYGASPPSGALRLWLAASASSAAVARCLRHRLKASSCPSAVISNTTAPKVNPKAANTAHMETPAASPGDASKTRPTGARPQNTMTVGVMWKEFSAMIQYPTPPPRLSRMSAYRQSSWRRPLVQPLQGSCR